MTDLLSELEAVVGLVEVAHLPQLEAFKAHVTAPDGDAIATCYSNVAHGMEEYDAAEALAAAVNFLRAHHAEIAAAVRDAKVLREQLRTTTAVAVTALFADYPGDVLERFTAPELESIVDLTASLKDKRVEAIYREAWDTAMRAGEG